MNDTLTVNGESKTMSTLTLKTTAKGFKRIRYCGGGQGGKYAVVEYVRKGESRPYRTRIIHGA